MPKAILHEFLQKHARYKYPNVNQTLFHSYLLNVATLFVISIECWPLPMSTIMIFDNSIPYLQSLIKDDIDQSLTLTSPSSSAHTVILPD